MITIKLLSDYTTGPTPNILQIIRDDQGDIHVKMIERDEQSSGVRIAAEGTRYTPAIRKAFYALIEAMVKELSEEKNVDLVEINAIRIIV